MVAKKNLDAGRIDLERDRKSRRLISPAVVGILVAVFCRGAWAQQLDRNHFGVLIGTRFEDLNYRARHATHPQDFFLPGANTPGSAGTTHIGRATFLALGATYETPRFHAWSVNVDGGGLIGDARTRHKNANDPRPDANAAFIFSEARYGFFVDAGLNYYVNNFYFGAATEFSGFRITNGWDRFSKDQMENTKTRLLFGVGPKAGFQFLDHFAFEGVATFGSSTNFGAQLKLKF